MKWIKLIKKIIASAIMTNVDVDVSCSNVLSSNYIMALNPMEKDVNINGYIIIIMIISIVILIGYTMVSNSNNK